MITAEGSLRASDMQILLLAAHADMLGLVYICI